VRFLFHGFQRDSGEPVDGHVEAVDKEAAYQVLSEHGIITEPPLVEDPKPLNLSQTPVDDFANALESALDSSSSQVSFDDLTERYRGKKVWVIDRDKIKNRVAQVVDTALTASEANAENSSAARQRVANAISGLFHDTRNIASQHTPESIAGMRGGTNDLTAQIGRLTGVVEQAEKMIAAMSVALRNVETGGGGVGPRRIVMPARTLNIPPNEALREIFQTNLDLRRAMKQQASPEPVQAQA
jgi:hypothetical protein